MRITRASAGFSKDINALASLSSSSTDLSRRDDCSAQPQGSTTELFDSNDQDLLIMR